MEVQNTNYTLTYSKENVIGNAAYLTLEYSLSCINNIQIYEHTIINLIKKRYHSIFILRMTIVKINITIMQHIKIS